MPMTHDEEYQHYTTILLPQINDRMTQGKPADAIGFIQAQMQLFTDNELLPSMLGKQLSLALLTKGDKEGATKAAYAAYDRLLSQPQPYDKATVYAMAETANMIGECLDKTGHRDQAIEHDLKTAAWLAKWREETRIPGLEEQEAILHNNLSRMYKAKGQLDDAMAQTQTALTLREAAVPRNPFFIATSYKNLGDIEVEQAKLLSGDERTALFAKAEQHLQRSSSMRVEQFSKKAPNHLKIAELQESLAYLEIARGNPEQANAYAAEAYRMALANVVEVPNAAAELAARLSKQGIVLAATAGNAPTLVPGDLPPPNGRNDAADKKVRE